MTTITSSTHKAVPAYSTAAPSNHGVDAARPASTTTNNAAVSAPKENVINHKTASTGYSSKTAMVTRTLLWVSLALYTALGAIEIAFSSLIVDLFITLTYSQRRYHITTGQPGGSYISAVPANLEVTPLYLALSAGCVAVVLVGFGGIGALVVRHKRNFSTSLFSKLWYHAWIISLVASIILNLATLIYTFGITNKYARNTIDTASLPGFNSPYVKYNSGLWDFSTWFGSLLDQRLVVDRDDIYRDFQYIRGWMFNLIPLFIFGLVVLIFTLVDGFLARKTARYVRQKEANLDAE